MVSYYAKLTPNGRELICPLAADDAARQRGGVRKWGEVRRQAGFRSNELFATPAAARQRRGGNATHARLRGRRPRKRPASPAQKAGAAKLEFDKNCCSPAFCVWCKPLLTDLSYYFCFPSSFPLVGLLPFGPVLMAFYRLSCLCSPCFLVSCFFLFSFLVSRRFFSALDVLR